MCIFLFTRRLHDYFLMFKHTLAVCTMRSFSVVPSKYLVHNIITVQTPYIMKANCLEFLSAPVAVMSVMQHETSLKPYTYSWDTFETLLKVLWHNLVTSLYHLVIYLKQTVKNRITMKHHKKNLKPASHFFAISLKCPFETT